MIVAAHLRQHETQIGDISGLRDGNRCLDRDPRPYLVTVDLDRRFETDVVLESSLWIELAPICLKSHMRALLACWQPRESIVTQAPTARQVSNRAITCHGFDFPRFCNVLSRPKLPRKWQPSVSPARA